MREPKTTWDIETGTATYTLWDIDQTPHTGVAICHEDDLDMMSEKTGLEIARKRATILAYKAYKYKINVELKALKQLYYSMKHSSKFNPESYENIMLQKQIRLKETDLTVVNNLLIEEKFSLKVYIIEKDAFYKQVRKLRNNQKNKV